MLTLAEHLRDELISRAEDSAWAGEPDTCISAYLRSNGRVKHPLNRIKAVLEAARRSDLFFHDGYILACDSTGTREINHPVFKLKSSAGECPK